MHTSIARHTTLAILILCPLLSLAQSVQVFQLRNGMQAAYVEDTTRRQLHIGITLRGGAALNTKQAPGLSHYFEHHFFGAIDSLAGTTSTDGSTSPRTQGSPLRSAGMMSTAATYPEHQTFTLSLSPDSLLRGLSALHLTLSTALERPPLHERILADIAGELQAAGASPWHYLFTAVRERLWKENAHAKDVAGKYHALRNLQGPNTFQALNPYLHPGNALLTATGPKQAAKFFFAADSIIGQWRPNSEGAGLPRIKAPQLQESIYFVEENEYADRPLLIMAWPVPGAREDAEDARTAQCVAIAARMQAAVFHRKLTATGLADDLWWDADIGYNPGHIMLRVAPRPDSLQACLAAITAAIQEAAQDPQALGAPPVIDAAERQAALISATSWDHSAARIDMLGRRWAMMDPAWANTFPLPMPTAATLQDFVARHIHHKPHIAALMVNGQWATLAERTFTATAAIASVSTQTQTQTQTQTPPPNYQLPTTNYQLPTPTYTLLRVHFTGNTLDPDPAGITTIATFAKLWKAAPPQKIYLNGYADGVGDGVANYHLSIRRAQAVQRILTQQHGIPEDHLIINPFGEAFPEFPDDTPQHRHLNRRVTFDLAPADAQPRFFIF